MNTSTLFDDLSRRVVAELGTVFNATDGRQLDRALDAILDAPRIFVLGIGREGLASKAFAMRLTHFGKTVHWGWDDTTPAVTAQDLFILPSGPANIPHLHYIAGEVKKTGATLLVVTAVPEGETAQLADVVLHLPAKTYGADDESMVPTFQPMGNLFEQSLFVFYDLLVMLLVERSGVHYNDMIARHRNFE
ncbi:SIS domain-containing protein [Salinisphaera sp. SPP-AMP-43]|uniref:SIS domain-containing protein n=1 Tax=Salinisphaera sp. SPP-AMP-43 TaxID=3121288 RepID=UPI003C6E8C13